MEIISFLLDFILHIDTHILAKLKRLNLPPAALADDA